MSGFDLLTSSWETMAVPFAAEGHHLCADDRAGMIEVANTGHEIQDNRPEIVMEAIRDVIAG